MVYSNDDLRKAIAVYKGMLGNTEVDTYISIAIDCMEKELDSREIKVFFSHRKYVEDKYREWINENALQDCAMNMVAFMNLMGWTNNANIIGSFRDAEKTIVTHESMKGEKQ